MSIDNKKSTQEMYKEGLNDILNSKTKDISVLRKIALKAFTKPIKNIADVQPLNWMQYKSQKFEWFLEVNKVQVACLVDDDMDGKKWTLTDYNTDFAPIFGGGTMPSFDSIDEGKKYVELKFLLWLKEASDILKPKASKNSNTKD